MPDSWEQLQRDYPSTPGGDSWDQLRKDFGSPQQGSVIQTPETDRAISRTWGQDLAMGGALAVRTIGGLLTLPTELAEAIPGPGTAVKAGAGALIGGGADLLAQEIEKSAGLRKEISPQELGVSAAAQAIPLGELANIGRAWRPVIRGLQGAGISAGATQATSLLESGKPASVGETLTSAGIGGAFGAGSQVLAQRYPNLRFRGRAPKPGAAPPEGYIAPLDETPPSEPPIPTPSPTKPDDRTEVVEAARPEPMVVPKTITKEMAADLKARKYTDAEIKAMTPGEAMENITKFDVATEPEPAVMPGRSVPPGTPFPKMSPVPETETYGPRADDREWMATQAYDEREEDRARRLAQIRAEQNKPAATKAQPPSPFFVEKHGQVYAVVDRRMPNTVRSIKPTLEEANARKAELESASGIKPQQQGAPDASQIGSTTTVPQPEVRTQVGKGAPLRPEGTPTGTRPAQAGTEPLPATQPVAAAPPPRAHAQAPGLERGGRVPGEPTEVYVPKTLQQFFRRPDGRWVDQSGRVIRNNWKDLKDALDKADVGYSTDEGVGGPVSKRSGLSPIQRTKGLGEIDPEVPGQKIKAHYGDAVTLKGRAQFPEQIKQGLVREVKSPAGGLAAREKAETTGNLTDEEFANLYAHHAKLHHDAVRAELNWRKNPTEKNRQIWDDLRQQQEPWADLVKQHNQQRFGDLLSDPTAIDYGSMTGQLESFRQRNRGVPPNEKQIATMEKDAANYLSVRDREKGYLQKMAAAKPVRMARQDFEDLWEHIHNTKPCK